MLLCDTPSHISHDMLDLPGIPLPPECESNPLHDLSVGELTIEGSAPMNLCRPCLRGAVAAWMNDAELDDPARPVTFTIRPTA